MKKYVLCCCLVMLATTTALACETPTPTINNNGVVLQNQTQNYWGVDVNNPEWGGFTVHTSDQAFWNTGWVRNGDISAEQNQQERSSYGSAVFDHTGFMVRTSDVSMESTNAGYGGNRSYFHSGGNQNYNVTVATLHNNGPSVMQSGISSVFQQNLYGHAGHNAHVDGTLLLNGNNSYTQVRYAGRDWAVHAGNSYTVAYSGGSADHHGNYASQVTGVNYGNTTTMQGGGHQLAAQGASASLNIMGNSYRGNSYVFAALGSTHDYVQHSETPHGVQDQAGSININISASTNNR